MYDSKKPSLSHLKTLKRKAVSLLDNGPVELSYLGPTKLPLVIQPSIDAVDLISWASNSREFIESHLQKHGAILFRKFNIDSTSEFQNFICSVSGELMDYRERSSPRRSVEGKIYTSTDYPADQSIFLHNENSYAQMWPMRIFFYCVNPASEGGETPLADVRKVFERIRPEIREPFMEKNILYLRNFSKLVGMPWQTAFQTNDRSEVEDYCEKAGYDLIWESDNRLKTRRIGQAAARHPGTGEMVWFNHAAFFHISTLDASIKEGLLKEFGEDGLPANTYYGDGSIIEPWVLDELREAYKSETVKFLWQQNDVLMVDNMLVAHGRSPYTGPRKIVVGMTQPFSYSDI